MSRADLLVERETHGRAHGPLYDSAHQLCLRYRIDGGTPHAGLFWTLKRDQDRLPILQLERKLAECGEFGKSTLPHLKLTTALLLIAAQDFDAAAVHYAALSREESEPEIRRQAMVSWRDLALIKGDFHKALDLEITIGKHFADSAHLPPTVYHPKSVLGSGVTGTTWLVTEIPTGRDRVVKIGPPQSGDQSAFVQFCNTMLAQQMDHPSLEKVLRVEPGPEGHWLRISRYRPGTSLEEQVSGHGPLPENEWLGVLWSLVESLLSAHAKGLVHKAIRPGHVLLVPWGLPGTLNRWRVLLHGSDQVPPRTILHALLAQPELAGKTALGQSAFKFAACLPPEVLGKPKGPTWFGPIQDVYGLGLLSAFALTSNLRPSALEWSAHSVDEEWKGLSERAGSWSQAPRLKHLFEVRAILEKIAGPERLGQLKTRELEQAILTAEEAVQDDPGSTACLADYAEALVNAGRHLEAEAAWNRCLELTPDHIPALTGRSFCRLHLGREKEAESDLKKATQSQPDQVEPLALLVRFLGGDRQPDKVVDLTREAIHKFPKDLSLRIERAKAFETLGKFPEALEEFQQATRIQPGNPHVWAMLARCQGNLQAHGKALEAWTKALQEPAFLALSEQARFLVERSGIHEKLNNPDRAKKDLEEAAVLDPTPFTRMAMVKFLARMGEFNQAEREQRLLLGEWAKTGELIPATAFLLWSDLFQDLAREAEQGELLEKVIQASQEKSESVPVISLDSASATKESEVPGENPAPSPLTAKIVFGEGDLAQAKLRRAMARIRVLERQEKPPGDRVLQRELIADLKEAAESQMPHLAPQAHLGLARLNVLHEKWAEASQAFGKALILDPNSLQGLVGIAQASLKLGKPDRAIPHCERALTLAPTSKAVRLCWGETMFESGRQETLVEKLNTWLVQAPLDQDYHRLMARALEKQGLLEAAYKEFLEISRAQPEDMHAREGLARTLIRLQIPKEGLLALQDLPNNHNRRMLAIQAGLLLSPDSPETKTLLMGNETDKGPEGETADSLLSNYRVLQFLGKKREAKAILRKLEQLEKSAIHVAFAHWLEVLGSGTPRKSLEKLDHLIGLFPHFLPWKIARVNHLLVLEKWELALRESYEALESGQKETWVLETRSRVLACAPSNLGGNNLAAVQMAREADGKAGRRCPRLLFTLAFCLAKEGTKDSLQVAENLAQSLLEPGGQIPYLVQQSAELLLQHLRSKKVFSWKGPAWHRLIIY